jgi:hypothetical protein
LTHTPRRNPTQRLDGAGYASMQAFATIFYIYIICNWLSITEL